MEFLSDHWFELGTGTAFLFLLIFVLILSSRLRAYKKMAQLVKGGTVEEHLIRLDRSVFAQKELAENLNSQVLALSGQISAFPHRLHLVRYNAFEKTGNDLSFSLALLNDQADGFVLTGIFSREDSRIYAKPIASGGSKYNLSEEELLAIKTAMASK